MIARNIGLQPPESTLALTEYALLYVTMAAAPWLVRNRGHVVVEVGYQRIPPALRGHVDRCILLLCALVAFAVVM